MPSIPGMLFVLMAPEKAGRVGSVDFVSGRGPTVPVYIFLFICVCGISMAPSIGPNHPHAERLRCQCKLRNTSFILPGIFAGSRRELSEDGFEMTWAVNVLAPFLLASLLQDAVTGRIVNVSSISAGRDLDWGNLNQVGPSWTCIGSA